MEPRKRGGKYSDVVNLLYNRGIIEGYPVQIPRDDLLYDDGVDIVFRFRNLTPKKLDEYADMLLLAAYQEASRYEDCKYKFAKVVVQVNRTAKGRKTLEPLLTYTAAKNTDSEVMIYGEEALGYKLPEEEKKKPFLKNKLEDILDSTNRYQEEGTVEKAKPFQVVSLTIGIRLGLRSEAAEKRIKDKKEAEEQGLITGRGQK